MKEKIEYKIIVAKTCKKFTDSQVRIHNTQYNHNVALEIARDNLFKYVDDIRKEATDFQGKQTFKNFLNLPFVSFVDKREMAQVIFDQPKHLPQEPTEIRTEKGTLIARFI